MRNPPLFNSKTFITEVADKLNSVQALTQYRYKLISVLKLFKKTLKFQFPNLNSIISAKLVAAIDNIKIPSNNDIHQETQNQAKENIIRTLVYILFYVQSYLINCSTFENNIKKKNLVEFIIGRNLFVKLFCIIMDLHNNDNLEHKQLDKNQIESLLKIFCKENFTVFYFRSDGTIKTEIDENDPKQQKLAKMYANLSSLFIIEFAQIVTNKDVPGFFRNFISKINPKIVSAASNNNNSASEPQGIMSILKQEMRLAPSTLIQKLNRAIAITHQSFYSPQNEQIEYNNFDALVKTKVVTIFKKIINDTGTDLSNIHYNWLQKFFLSFGSNPSSSPDKIARTTGNNLIGIEQNNTEQFITQNYFLESQIPNYLKVIENLTTTYQSVFATNFKIRKTCLLSINKLVKLALADDTHKDSGLLVSIYSNIPAETPFFNKLYQAIYKNFATLTSAKKIDFLLNIGKFETNQNFINPNFKPLIEQLNLEAFNLKEITQLITTIEKHNFLLKNRLKGFFGLFRLKEERIKNKIPKEFLTRLDQLKRQKEAEENTKNLSQKIQEREKLNQVELQKEFIVDYTETIEQKQQDIQNALEQKLKAEDENKKLQLKSILDSGDALETKWVELALLFKKDGELSKTEIAQIRQLLIEHKKLEEQKKALTDNTQEQNQKAFYALLLNKLDSTFAAMRSISTGYIQTYDNQATGMASAACSALGAIVPLIGSAFNGISTVLNWANQKRLMTESKEISSIALTSCDDAVLARILALAITELLNNHPKENYKLININPNSIAILVEHLVRKLLVIFIKENDNNYQTKIHTNFDNFVKRCVQQLTEKVPTSIFDINTNIENFFQAQIVFNNDIKIDAEKLLQAAKPSIKQNNTLIAHKPETPEKFTATPLVQLVKSLDNRVNFLEKIPSKKIIISNNAATTTSETADTSLNQEIAKLQETVGTLIIENASLKKRQQEAEKQFQILAEMLQPQSSISYQQRTFLTSSLTVVNGPILQQNALPITTMSSTHNSLLFAKNRIMLIPARGNKQYKRGEIIGNFIFVKDKPSGIEPGFLGFLIDEQFYKTIFNIIISNTNKEPYNDFINNNFQSSHELEQNDVNLFMNNHDCCLAILDELEKNKLLSLWLVKQDYEEPAPGEDTVTIRPQDLEKTNAFKTNARFIGAGLTTRIALGVRKRTITEENANAILETLGTTIASLYTKTHFQYLLKGKYLSGTDKFMTVSKWDNNFKDFKHKLHAGYLVKLDDKKNKLCMPKCNKGNELYSIYFSDNKIKNLGAAKVFTLLSNDHDAIGSQGSNKGELSGEFFGIDFGHTFREPNRIIQQLKDDGSIKLPANFKNISVFDDIPLSEFMKGVLILAKLRGISLNKNLIESYGFEFAATLDEVKPLQDNAIFDEHKEYFKKFIHNDTNYKMYLEKITNAEKYYLEAANTILKTFQQRLFLTAQQVDLLDNLEKLCNKTIHIHQQYNQKIWLNHLKKTSRDVIWQLHIEKDTQGNAIKLRFYSSNKNAKSILENYFNTINNKTANPITLRISKNTDGKGIQFEIEPQYFEQVFQALSEANVAAYKKQPLASTPHNIQTKTRPASSEKIPVISTLFTPITKEPEVLNSVITAPVYNQPQPT